MPSPNDPASSSTNSNSISIHAPSFVPNPLPSRMTQEEALTWIVQIFEEAPDRITFATPRTNIPAWDSLGVLSLMAGLDETFGIVANGAELNRMQSVEEIVALLRTHGKVSN